MTWLLKLLDAAKLAVEKPKRDAADLYLERMSGAFEAVSLYRKNPDLGRKEKKNIEATVEALYASLDYFITQFPAAALSHHDIEAISQLIIDPLFNAKQRTRLQAHLKQTLRDLFQTNPVKAYKDFLERDRYSSNRDYYDNLIVDLVLETVESLGSQSPTLAVQAAASAVHRTARGSRQRGALIKVIEKFSSGYAMPYERVSEGIENPLMLHLLYSDDKKVLAAVTKAWHDYIGNLTRTIKTQPAKPPDPPGVLTIPTEVDDFRLQVYSAICELTMVAARNPDAGNQVHALGVARENFRNHFAFLAEANPQGAAKFGLSLVLTLWSAAKYGDSYPKITSLAQGFINDITGQFISTALAERIQTVTVQLPYKPALLIAQATSDMNLRCAALEAAQRNFERMAATDRVAAAYGMLEIMKLATTAGERKPASPETPAQVEKILAIKRNVMHSAYDYTGKFPRGFDEEGAGVCMVVAGEAQASGDRRLRAQALKRAQGFCQELAVYKPARAVQLLEKLGKQFSKLKAFCLAVHSLVARIQNPRPLSIGELAALKRLGPELKAG